MTSRRYKGFLALIFLTMLWGTTFPAIKVTVTTIGFAYYVAARFGLATILLLPLVRIRNCKLSVYARQGALLGLLYFGGIALQGLGMEYTRASNAAFVTGLSVVMVYVFEVLVGGAPLSFLLTIAVVLATAGLYLLSFSGGPVELMVGDAIVLVGAVFWALQIMAVSRFAKGDLLSLLFLQGAVTAATAIAVAPFTGLLKPESFVAVLPSLAYLATACTLLANALQLYGQRWVSSVEAAVIYLLEPVFAALFSYFLLGENLSLLQMAGAALILAAMAASSLARTGPSDNRNRF